MRKWLLALLLLGLLQAPAMAQRHVGPHARPQRISRQLGLTPRQRQRISRIMREDQGDRTRMYRRIRGVLTPHQMAHLRQIRRQQRSARPRPARRYP